MTNQTARHTLLQLQLDWNRLARSPRALATAGSWHLPLPRLRSLDDLLAALGHAQVGRAANADDALLGRLVVLAREHPLAARVVLQRLLPGVGAIARRWNRGRGDLATVTDDLVATAWTVVRTYPVEDRPTYVVAGLLRTIEYQACRRPLRQRPAPTPVDHAVLDGTVGLTWGRSPSHGADGGDPLEPADALEEICRLVLEARRRGLDDHDLVLVRRLVAGATTAEIAAEAAVTDRTVRNHRSALVHRLRAAAALDDLARR